MITLYTALSLWGLPSISPACMELETWLRMAKLPYNTIVVTADNLKLAPKGKVPFIEYQGKLVGDATLIIEMFKQQQAINLDADLTFIKPPYGSPIIDYALHRANLCKHYERMTQEFFSERSLNQSIPVHF